MKKIFSIFAMAAGLFMASCSNDDIKVNTVGEEAEVSFTVGVENLQGTRAISDGQTADKLVYSVFNADGERITTIKQVVREGVKFPTQETVKLAKGQTYFLVFWAQNSACKAYTVSDDMKVSVDYKGLNNDETRDAFYKAEKITVTGSTSLDVVLTRPFAQINVGVYEEDWKDAVASGIEIVESSVLVKANANTDINLLTGEASGNVAVSYELNAIPSDPAVLNANEMQYKWLSMSYILAGDKTNVDLKFTFRPSNGEDIVIESGLNNVPVQRNWRTNILGQLLTGTIDINISIDPIYNGDFNYPEWTTIADGVSYDKESKTFILSDVKGLQWFADVTNGVKSHETVNANFYGQTVKLASNVDLANVAWTPAGTAQIFKGTFDGGNNTISNLTVNTTGKAYAGLFATAQGTVKNVKLANVNVSGQWMTGAVVGHGLCSIIENCHVDGGSVVSTPYNNDEANNVGGIVGYLSAEPNASVKNCSVKNITVTAYRDLGGVVGTASGANVVVDGNLVDNVVVLADQSVPYKEEKDANAGEVVGRNLANTELDGNTVNNVTVSVLKANAEGDIVLATANDLKAMAAMVNADKDKFAGKTIVLENDIDMLGEAFTPANIWNPENKSVFDGNGKTIKNVVNPLFHNATVDIKNLTVESASIVGTGSFKGAIAGTLYGNVENCHVKGATIESTSEKGIRIGALVGMHNSGVMTDCSAEDITLKGYHNVGGLVGTVNETSNRVYTNCTVKNATITNTAVNPAGALVGNVNGVSLTLKGCSFEGVTINGEVATASTGFGNAPVVE